MVYHCFRCSALHEGPGPRCLACSAILVANNLKAKAKAKATGRKRKRRVRH